MIDLHLHTTASDGRCTPADLARRADEAGLRVIAVTDHDTMAGVRETHARAAAYGITVVPGIEITSVLDGKDVHVLGYYLPESGVGLRRLLAAQREERVERAREIAARLARAGAPVDVDALLADASSRGGSVARPQLAAALVAAGHATSIADAFDRLLGEGCCGYVPHRGPEPADVVSAIVAEGGVASLAHPGPTRRDDIIPALVERGLGAIEAYHSAHDAGQQLHYVDVARRYELSVTGGSDYHGEGVRRAEFFGVVTLPREEFDRFQQRAGVALT
jgi:predicted metal-dependent phosphoesterase TrpH